ncbi:hypothetical protein NMG60_11014943 [Bertholletia excelsa]
MRGDWEAARSIINGGPESLKKSITMTGETALHLAAASGHTLFVKNWLEHDNIGGEDVAHPNGKVVTALGFAAATGTKPVAQEILSHPKGNRCKPVGFKPLYMAALQGYGSMTNYLYSESNFESWNHTDQSTLLNTCISSGIDNLPQLIIQNFSYLARQKDDNGETPLAVLARKPSAFVERPFWERVINCVFPRQEEEVQNKTTGHLLFGKLWKHYLQPEQTVEEIISYGSQLLYSAADCGNFEFLVQLLNSCPELIYKAFRNTEALENMENTEAPENIETIFHIAIRNRDEDTFNLIHEIGAFKNLITDYGKDTGKKNNILHKAALLPDKNRVKPKWGTALRVRQEILWYKAVESVVSPLFKDMRNADGLTPHELFLEQHEELMNKGEKEMKVPEKKDGATAFKIFLVSEAIAMLFSSASILSFLSILISSYTEGDFLTYLPIRLLMGMTTLFIAITAMMISFCSAFLLTHCHGLAWALSLGASFAFVPIMFICLASPLLTAVVHSTFRSFFMFKSRKRLFQHGPEQNPIESNHWFCCVRD